MKVREIIQETQVNESTLMLDPGIDEVLKKKGYRSLGQGAEQEAWLEPGGKSVLKIFGTDRDKPSQNFNKSHHMFFEWAKYCMANSSNPFLVKFDDYESFIFNDRRYLQIRQELLKPLPNEISLEITQLYTLVDFFQNLPEIEAAIYDNGEVPGGREHFDFKRIEKLANRLGRDKTQLLIKTFIDIIKISNQKGYRMDMHGDDYMMRSDKTPVIIDPWIVD